MSFRKTTTGLAAILATGLSGAALAQNLDTELGLDAGETLQLESSAEQGAEMRADAATRVNVGRVVSALRNGQQGSTDVAGIDASTEIEVVAVSELRNAQGQSNGEALDQAIADAGDTVKSIRDEVQGNAELVAALEADGHSADEVIAVIAAADGSVDVIVDDRV
ncbi:hypothetical protein HKCCE3408_17045 [Rhodobacterales bacterium HKCCE3408]|nr:hypothetical protein [Rhodobacterales bacterium HKCCE3408]